MSFLSHHHRRFQHDYQASADFAALLSVVEGRAHAPAAESYACEWCPGTNARQFRGAYLCRSCILELHQIEIAAGRRPRSDAVRFTLSAAEIDGIVEAGGDAFAYDDTHDDEADFYCEGDE